MKDIYSRDDRGDLSPILAYIMVLQVCLGSGGNYQEGVFINYGLHKLFFIRFTYKQMRKKHTVGAYADGTCGPNPLKLYTLRESDLCSPH